MTNREWLESLSDEELAQFMMKAVDCSCCAADSKKCGDSDISCVLGKLLWLQAEHNDEE